MQRLYDEIARVSARRRVISLIFLDSPLSLFPLYFAYGNPNPSEGSVGITSPRQIGGPVSFSFPFSSVYSFFQVFFFFLFDICFLLLRTLQFGERRVFTAGFVFFFPIGLQFLGGETRGVYFLILVVCTMRGRRCPFGDSFCASFLCGVPGAEEVRAGEREERRRGERGRSLAWRRSSHVRTSLVFLCEILVRGERACTEFGGGCGAPQSRGEEELTTSFVLAGKRATVTTRCAEGERGRREPAV
jgi:hypothetical protein